MNAILPKMKFKRLFSGIFNSIIYIRLMLSLSVQNYAIIRSLELQFSPRVSIITGETGAGKSILLGALGLVLGDRADSKALFDQDRKCIVEAVFQIEEHRRSWFESNEIEFDKHCIIRREILPNGKSRSFINDTPVNLHQLRELTATLVQLHSQHETIDLIRPALQMQLLDAYAGNFNRLKDYRKLYREFFSTQNKIKELQESLQKSEAEMDYIKYQLQELEDASLSLFSLKELEEEQLTLSHVEDIQMAVEEISAALDGNEYSAKNTWTSIRNRFKSIKDLSADLNMLFQRAENAFEEIEDVVNNLEKIKDQTNADPQRLLQINDKLNLIYKLFKKHHCDSLEKLIEIRDELAIGLNDSGDKKRQLEILQKQKMDVQQELLIIAADMHEIRLRNKQSVEKNVIDLLKQMGMPDAVFEIELRKVANGFNDTGISEIRFLFTANKGFSPRDIKDVASGGELSRFMLALKTLPVEGVVLPALIFDEIDTGISGEVALKTADVLRKLGNHQQLVCITHLPQIAAIADTHFYIYKENVLGKTETHVRILNREEKINQIAEMLSGVQNSEAARNSAEELLLQFHPIN